jgi:hypothetical protein
MPYSFFCCAAFRRAVVLREGAAPVFERLYLGVLQPNNSCAGYHQEWS